LAARSLAYAVGYAQFGALVFALTVVPGLAYLAYRRQAATAVPQFGAACAGAPLSVCAARPAAPVVCSMFVAPICRERRGGIEKFDGIDPAGTQPGPKIGCTCLKLWRSQQNQHTE
jgi:hypothetical protein